MQSDILSSKSFMRAQVKNRMLRRAAELWGYSETELEAFDPLVALLIEACSVEFEKISAEISETQNRLLNRLAQLMNPEVETAKAAYGILQMRSTEPVSFVTPDSQFAFRLRNTDRTVRQTEADVYFSPLRKLPIFNASITYIASSHTLFQIEEGVQKVAVAQAKSGYIASFQTLWIGLELDEDITSLQQLSVYFDWQSHPERDTWYKYLPFSEWYNGRHKLTTQVGLPQTNLSEFALTSLEKELDGVKKLEKETEWQFESQFVTITGGSEIEKKLYPEELEQWFGQSALKSIRKTLCWIQIRFSQAISTEALNSLLCSVNAIPIMNRKLNKLTYKLQPNFNIIPLEANGLFLGIRDVRDSNSVRLQSVPLGNLLELQARTYTLQYGINRFDDRNAREMLTNMLDTIRDESSSFSALGEDFLSSVIRELNQTIARLEIKVGREDILESPVPYLVIKQAQQSENVFVEYWTCHGSQANRIPVGSKLSAYADANVQKDRIYLLTTTQGGRDRLKASEKINHYRKALLSRNRIVTLEDVRASCLKELGDVAQSVEVHRSFMISNALNAGFVRCIEVIVKPARGIEQTAREWEQRGLQLKAILEAQTVGNLPFRIIFS
ncbi:hypothetical protein [Xanthocytophaga agilis]|uniref:Uncharacterized protein n=1 Tax=Xanthocytophaga agilis TaxID=3048010 RepID=A0AAE3R3D2_9BACT|nr:hypothetical protein [Xanthocytophaga agilis]MDJ1502994.1 hypothetical protein [Xanthocytophaga agilis]